MVVESKVDDLEIGNAEVIKGFKLNDAQHL